jgi:hypothetical protein
MGRISLMKGSAIFYRKSEHGSQSPDKQSTCYKNRTSCRTKKSYLVKLKWIILLSLAASVDMRHCQSIYRDNRELNGTTAISTAKSWPYMSAQVPFFSTLPMTARPTALTDPFFFFLYILYALRNAL